jgi:hypothetical protein
MGIYGSNNHPFSGDNSMATRVVSGFFDDYNAAERAVYELVATGISERDISVIANNSDNRHAAAVAERKSSGVVTGAEVGATYGTVVGGGAGLLAGLGMLAIPGIGPVVAVGWLAATAAGAVAGAAVGGTTGGIIGSLTHAGVSKEHAHVYAEGIRRGGTLVTARVDEVRAGAVEDIMIQFHAIDPDTRGTAYRAGGWKGFDERGPANGDPEVGDRYRDPYRDRSTI